MQAILAVDKNDTPIVIMDIGMPGMNGVEAAEWIRKSHPDCVIIFLTAYDDFSYAKRAVSLHALEYLLKPCDDEELIPVMEEAMRQVDLCRIKAESPAGGAGFAGSGLAAAGGGGRGRESGRGREDGRDGEGGRDGEASAYRCRNQPGRGGRPRAGTGERVLKSSRRHPRLCQGELQPRYFHAGRGARHELFRGIFLPPV